MFLAYSNMVQSLTKNLELLKAELMDSCSVQSRQEEVISTLKEETSILVDLEKELKDMKRRFKELQNKNEEQKMIIAELNKVRNWSYLPTSIDYLSWYAVTVEQTTNHLRIAIHIHTYWFSMMYSSIE